MAQKNELSNLNKSFIADLRKRSTPREKYKNIFESIFREEIPYIPFQHIIKLNENILPTTLKILEHYNLDTEVNPLWGIEGIQSMFLKGVNPATAEYIAATIQIFKESLPKPLTKHISVIEFGSGAGWATLIMWVMFKSLGNATTYTVDTSPYALASTTLLLDYFDVPYVIIKGEIPDHIRSFRGVVLQFEDFSDALLYHGSNSLTGAYSNHGTSYLSEKEHALFINRLYDKLSSSGIFVTDSLNPNMRLSLNKLDIMIHVLKGQNVKNLTGKKSVVKKKGPLSIVTNLYDKPALKFMDLLHYHLFHNLKLFLGYMKTVGESEKTQRALYEKIGTPSESYYKSSQIRAHFTTEPIQEKQTIDLPVFVQTALLRKK